MNKLEDQLNKLPQAKLGRKTDFYLRFNFWQLSWRNYFNNLSSVFIIKRLVPATLVVILLLGLVGLPYYAYASDDVVQGNVLYPIKQAVEKIELSLANTPEKKVAVLTKLANRRLAEVNKLNQQAGPQIDSNLAQTINQMVLLTTQADEEASSTLMTEQKTIIESNLESIKRQQLASVENIVRNRGPKASDQLLHSVTSAIDNLKQGSRRLIYPDNSLGTPTSTPTSFPGFFWQNRASSSWPTTGISTTTEKWNTRFNNWLNQSTSTKLLSNFKERINNRNSNFTQLGTTTKDTNNRFKGSDNKLNKTQPAFDFGNFNQTQNLINSSSTASNNYRNFLRHTDQASSTWQSWQQKNKSSASNRTEKGQ